MGQHVQPNCGLPALALPCYDGQSLNLPPQNLVTEWAIVRPAVNAKPFARRWVGGFLHFVLTIRIPGTETKRIVRPASSVYVVYVAYFAASFLQRPLMSTELVLSSTCVCVYL
jgi:uncharacterized membrane protein